MGKTQSKNSLNKIKLLSLFSLLLGGSLPFIEKNFTQTANANPSFLEYRWDNSPNYKKLYYWQSSSESRDRATYYLVMREKDRNRGILKLKVTFPDYFNAKISPKKLTLCKVILGGMLARTKCEKQIPAVFEVAENNSYFEVFPNEPIPVGGSYAVRMKIFNPDQRGMFQLNAMAQAPGDVPITSYLGSWSIDIN